VTPVESGGIADVFWPGTHHTFPPVILASVSNINSHRHLNSQ
jgi:hypothetical protein